MSKTNDSDFSGMLGKQVGVRKVRGKVVVVNRPKRTMSQPIGGQAQSRFLEASQYAKRQLLDEGVKALYSTGITERKKSAYAVAMGDYLKDPVVQDIDVSGEDGVAGNTILVKAVDDFMVTKVKIRITDASGALIEEGEAVPDAMQVNLWGYTVKSANPLQAGTTIRATAWDRPGNKGQLTKVL
jgi:hypothetical protein